MPGVFLPLSSACFDVSLKLGGGGYVSTTSRHLLSLKGLAAAHLVSQTRKMAVCLLNKCDLLRARNLVSSLESDRKSNPGEQKRKIDLLLLARRRGAGLSTTQGLPWAVCPRSVIPKAFISLCKALLTILGRCRVGDIHGLLPSVSPGGLRVPVCNPRRKGTLNEVSLPP